MHRDFPNMQRTRDYKLRHASAHGSWQTRVKKISVLEMEKKQRRYNYARFKSHMWFSFTLRPKSKQVEITRLRSVKRFLSVNLVFFVIHEILLLRLFNLYVQCLRFCIKIPVKSTIKKKLSPTFFSHRFLIFLYSILVRSFYVFFYIFLLLLVQIVMHQRDYFLLNFLLSFCGKPKNRNQSQMIHQKQKTTGTKGIFRHFQKILFNAEIQLLLFRSIIHSEFKHI